MRSIPALTTFAAAALIVTLAGCTGSPTDTASDAPPTDRDLTSDDMPLNAYRDLLWLGGASPEEMERTQIEQAAKVDARVVPCMKEQGFEYIPDTSDLDELEAAENDRETAEADGEEIAADEWEPDERSWVASYGYGIVDYPGKQDEPDVPEVTDEDVAAADPNASYLDTLSESERAAYDEALFGPPVDKDSLDGTEEYDWTEAGCVGRAAHELEAEGEIPGEVDLSPFEGVITRMGEFTESIDEEADYAELDREWASCMSDAGESGFTRQPEAVESIVDEANELTSGVAIENGEEVTDEPAAEPVDPDGPEMEDLRQREAELALADLDCREKTDYTQATLRIQFDLEEQFIADNKTELDALRLAIEQAG